MAKEKKASRAKIAGKKKKKTPVQKQEKSKVKKTAPKKKATKPTKSKDGRQKLERKLKELRDEMKGLESNKVVEILGGYSWGGVFGDFQKIVGLVQLADAADAAGEEKLAANVRRIRREYMEVVLTLRDMRKEK